MLNSSSPQALSYMLPHLKEIQRAYSPYNTCRVNFPSLFWLNHQFQTCHVAVESINSYSARRDTRCRARTPPGRLQSLYTKAFCGPKDLWIPLEGLSNAFKALFKNSYAALSSTDIFRTRHETAPGTKESAPTSTEPWTKTSSPPPGRSC